MTFYFYFRDEVFNSNDHDEEKSKVLYPSFKHPLPNIFQGTAFKKHAEMLIEKKQNKELLKIFFFLPSTTDWKEKINTFFGNVNLHQIDSPYEGFVNYSVKSKTFFLHDLDSRSGSEREAAKEIVWNYMKHIAGVFLTAT